MSDLRAVLTRASLDASFARRLQDDPARALADYTLDPREREDLVAGGERARALLARLAPVAAGPEGEDAVAPVPPRAGTITGREQVFHLRVQPRATRDADGVVHLRYTASVDAHDPQVAALEAAVREAPEEERPDRLLELARTLRRRAAGQLP